MQLHLHEGERVLKIDEASRSVQGQTAHGVLCLTTSRIIFITGASGQEMIEVRGVSAIAPVNNLGVWPVGFSITLPGEIEVRFAVRQRNDWMELLKRVRTGDVASIPDAPELSEGSLGSAGPIEPLVSWPAIMAWIAAPFALIPFLGGLPTLLLLIAAVMLLVRPKGRLDRTTGIAAAVFGAISIAAFGVEIFGMLNASGGMTQPTGASIRMTTALKVMQVAVLIFSVIVHECGHALAAYWGGDDTAVRRKRLTLNPIPHIDLFGSIILPAILVFSGSSAVFGWAKPVPINLANLRNRFWGNLAVSLAGVSANLLLAMLAMSALLVMGSLLPAIAPEATVQGLGSLVGATTISGVAGGAVLTMFADLLKMAVIVNLVLLAFNLLPIPPLDGSHIMEILLPKPVASLFAKIRPYGFIILVVAIYAGVTGFIIRWVLTGAHIFLAIVGSLCGLS